MLESVNKSTIEYELLDYVYADPDSGMSMGQRLRDRIDDPDDTNDAREIWMLIRSWLTIFRVLLVIAIIIVAEIFEEVALLNFSLSVWAIVVGFPLFLLISMIIIQGDKRFAPDLEEKRRKRMKYS